MISNGVRWFTVLAVTFGFTWALIVHLEKGETETSTYSNVPKLISGGKFFITRTDTCKAKTYHS